MRVACWLVYFILFVLQVEEIDEDLLRKFSYMASGDVSPIQAVIGPIAAQEIVKVSAITRPGSHDRKHDRAWIT